MAELIQEGIVFGGHLPVFQTEEKYFYAISNRLGTTNLTGSITDRDIASGKWTLIGTVNLVKWSEE